MEVRLTVPRGVLFHFKRQFEQGLRDAADPLVKLAREAFGQKYNGTPFFTLEVSEEEARLIEEYREQGRQITEDYLQRKPKVQWVPRGGWNIGVGDTVNPDYMNRFNATHGRMR